MKFTIMYIANIRSRVFRKFFLLSQVNQYNHRAPTQCVCNRLLFYSMMYWIYCSLHLQRYIA